MTQKMNKSTAAGEIRQIPYGVTDYERIRRENFYYIDKTSFIPELEKAGSYLFFIRPRRFGKSLFISLLKSYYDIAYKDRFDEFFKGTWIYDHPTKERGEYLVLDFNFSGVNPDPGKIEETFNAHVQGHAVDFLEKYDHFLSIHKEKEYFSNKIKSSGIASDILFQLMLLCKGAHLKLYVIIDEYDNFANTVLSDVGSDAYHQLTHGIGQFRAFFNSLKEGTTGTEAPVTRSFITGVSPITMDDVTSGYNIGENVSLDAAFNRMLGFAEVEVIKMLDYYSSQNQLPSDTGETPAIIKKWYGNYLFSKYAPAQERVYNPDMVLYFLKEYFKNQSFPEDLLDYNVKIDYYKLRHLILIDKGNTGKTNGNFSRLKEIIEQGYTSANLVKAFPLSELKDTDKFVSLLFYFGLLTIDRTVRTRIQFQIPNETIQKLYYEYIQKGYNETNVFSIDLSLLSVLIEKMAFDGEWKPLLDFITGRMKESMSLRDLMIGEKAVQAFLNVYLGLSDLYIIRTEPEVNKGYADILMEPFLARYQDIQYSYMIEIKYINRAAAQPPFKTAAQPLSKTAAEKSKKPSDQEIKNLVAEAENQLHRYSLDEKLAKTLAKTTLIKLVLVFCGHEAVYIGEAARAPRL